MTDASILTTYVLLSARYGNSSISNNDINKFLLKLSSTIFQYGPSWEKRLDVQSTLRQLSEDEIRELSNILNQEIKFLDED